MYIYPYIYSHFFTLGIFIFSRGGYNNAQPAKSYLDFSIWQWHFLGMASLRNLSFLLPVLLQYQNAKQLKIRPRQRPNFKF